MPSILEFENLSLRAIGFQSLTVGSTATAFAVAQYAGVVYARYTVDTADVRVRLDGTAPTLTSGELHESDTGQVYELHGARMVANTKLIRATGSDGKVNVHFFAPKMES